MTLIKCPGCSHTVSSVASKCPQCGTMLTQYRFVQGQGGALTECRRCARKVLSEARMCPYCGASHPGRRVPYWAVGLVSALAVPALVVAALRDRAPEVAPLPSPPAPVSAAEVAVKPAPPVRAGVANPKTGPAESRAEPADSTAPPTARARWINDWANVRVGRSLDSQVVRVLRPGMEVQADDRQEGWWAVYLEGRFVGYVAGSLLSSQLPDSLRPDTAGYRRD